MPRATPAMLNFNAGEFSPAVEGRTDVEKYNGGCHILENFIPMVQGPARRRSGTRYVNEVMDSQKQSWLSTFKFNVTQSFILEWGDRELRFNTAHGALLDPVVKLITGATSANPVVITAVGHGFANGTRVFITGVLGEIQINNRYFTVANATTDTFELLGINGAAYGAYTSVGEVSKVYSIVSPYSTGDLVDSDGFFALRFAQIADVVYIANTNKTKPLYKLSRFGNTNWTLVPVVLQGGPFGPLNSLTTPTMYADAQTGTVTVTATDPVFTDDKIGSLLYLEHENIRNIRPWEPGRTKHIGDLSRYNGVTYLCFAGGVTGTVPPTHLVGDAYDGSGGTMTNVGWTYQDPGYGWGTITAVQDAHFACTVVVGDPVANTRPVIQYPFNVIGAGTPTSKWAFGAINAGAGYPSHVTFFRARLVLMRDQNIWTSVSEDFENFNDRTPAGLVTEDMAISVQMPTQDSPAWLQEGTDLAIGTAGGEFVAGSINASNPIGPSNTQIKPQATRGSRAIPALRIGNEILFVQTSGRKLRSLQYDFYTNTYSTEDLTVLAEHITRGGIMQMAYAQEPDSVIWMVRASG
jgi:hypothetical protein